MSNEIVQPYRSFEKGSAKKLIGLAVAVVIMAVALVVPGSEELSKQGVMAIGIMLATISLWICNTLPVGITGVFACIAIFVFKIQPDMGAAFAGFTSGPTWFVFGVFTLTAVMTKSTVGERLVSALVRRAGSSSKRIVLAYMIATAIVSMFITDAGAVAVGMALGLPFLIEINAKEERPNLGKALTLGIACGAIIGGFITPFGHSLNILCLGLMEQTYGISIGFIQWVIPGAIIAVILIPTIWFILCKVFPPESLTEEQSLRITAGSGGNGYGKWSVLDKKALIFIVLLIAFFVLGNWIPVLANTTVMLVAVALLFVPGINILTWDEFVESEGWNVFLMLGGIMSLGAVLTSSGAGAWISNIFLQSGIMEMNVLVGLLLIICVIYAIHTFCPVAPALCTLFVPPVMAYCVAMGISPGVFVMLMASLTAGSFLMPFSPPMLISYSENYYTIPEMLKPGVPAAIIYVVVEVLVIYFIGGFLLPMV